MNLPLAYLPSVTEMLPILVVVVLLFGAKQIPQLARSLGEGVKELKKGMKEITADEEDPKPA